jgi:hypothetical protein
MLSVVKLEAGIHVPGETSLRAFFRFQSALGLGGIGINKNNRRFENEEGKES